MSVPFDRFSQVFAVYLSNLPASAGPILLGAMAALLALWVQTNGSKDRARLTGNGLFAVALAVGASLAWSQMSVVDDAFISFRYADHFNAGDGLVFNKGERVEGYTNFLWTVLVALGARFTPLTIPHATLVLGAFCYVLNGLVVLKIGRRLCDEADYPAHLPFAACLVVLQGSVITFASSGLETPMAMLFVDLGALFLLSPRQIRGAGLAGACLIAATLTRPDHALFYVAGSAVVAMRTLPGLRDAAATSGMKGLWAGGLREVAAYSMPFSIWLAYAGWKLSFYGSLVPNTYYTKSVDLWYVDQGLVYLMTFLFGAHFWLVGALFLWWLMAHETSAPRRDFRRFATIGAGLFLFYLAKIGGGFMYGRYMVTLVPLGLLGAEAMVHGLLSSKRRTLGLVFGALLGATAYGVTIISPGQPRWLIGNEGANYRVNTLVPLTISHRSFRVAKAFEGLLTERGIHPTIATCCIGMVAYYSHMPTIDLLGLTDAEVAKKPLSTRGKPGHEKYASMQYMEEREIRFARWSRHPKRYHAITQLDLGARVEKNWHIFTYDRTLMNRIQREAPDLGFVDFVQYLDHYLSKMASLEPKLIRRDLAFFDRYYFRHNSDAARRQRIVAHLDAADPQ